MKNNFYKLMTLGLFLFANTVSSFAQEACGTTQFTQQLREKYPHLVQDFDNYNQEMANKPKSAGARSTEVYVIPVVFHVLHVNGVENISDAQIFAQITRLNTDYRKLNIDTASIVSRFDTLAADIHLEFQLAQLDPDGNCTNGIERIYTHKTMQADDLSKLNQWPRDKYLNIWVVHDIAGSTSSATILGFAHFPSDVAGPLFPFDGIIAIYSTVNGTSRTLTHEIGHYLNLQHTWGSTNDPNVACGDDLVNDTPPTKGHFSTCPLLDAVCTTNPFTANFKFDGVTTTSGTTDPTPIAPLTGINNITPFTAVGVSPNAATNGKFEFSDWGTGAPDGATSYAALTGAINTGKYYQVKFTPQYGYNMKYTGINFQFSRSATGVRTFAIRSSRDGFAANIATASVGTAEAANMSIQTGNVFFLKNDTTRTITSAKLTISATAFTNDTMPVTFRIYAWNAEDAAGTFSLDSVNITGSSDLIENVQNYMDYSSCTNMFSINQGERMRNAVESTVSSRNNLWSASNLLATGITNPQPCKPFPDFYADKLRICAGDVVRFTKNVQYGTETARTWTFDGGTPSTSTSATPVNVTYNTPGLYKVTLSVSNAAGADSVIKTDYIRVDADWADIDYNGSYTEDFESTGNFYWDWQVRNYDNNPYTWGVCPFAGYNGSAQCVMMSAYNDYQYDVDDLTSPSYDLSYTSGNVLTFKCAAASSAGAGVDVNDLLKVYISGNCGTSWNLRATFKDSTLINNGYQPTYFTPGASTVWTERSVPIPATYATANVRFKFEYTAGSASNNIYLDYINIAGTVGISENSIADADLLIYPNPANEVTTIAYHLTKKSDTKIEVVDVLGKSVYATATNGQMEGDYKVQLSKHDQHLRNGIYFVKFSIGNESITKKVVITE